LQLLDAIKKFPILKDKFITFYKGLNLSISLKDLSNLDEIFSISIIELFLNNEVGIFINIYKNHFDVYIPNEYENRFKSFLIDIGWDITKIDFVFVDNGDNYLFNMITYDGKDIISAKKFITLKIIKLLF
jgi:hypothetical protein